MIKKLTLITLITCLSILAKAQVLPLNDTVQLAPNVSVPTVQWRMATFASGGTNYRVPYFVNPSTGKLDFLITSKYTRAFYASLAGDNIFLGYNKFFGVQDIRDGLLRGYNGGTNTWSISLSGQAQFINIFKNGGNVLNQTEGDARWAQLSANNVFSGTTNTFNGIVGSFTTTSVGGHSMDISGSDISSSNNHISITPQGGTYVAVNGALNVTGALTATGTATTNSDLITNGVINVQAGIEIYNGIGGSDVLLKLDQHPATNQIRFNTHDAMGSGTDGTIQMSAGGYGYLFNHGHIFSTGDGKYFAKADSNYTAANDANVLHLNGGTLTGDLILPNTTPTNADQAVPKFYIDNLITGITWKNAVNVKTTGNVTLSGLQTIDGVAGGTYRILVNDQSDPKQNGIYDEKSTSWTRVVDADTGDEIAMATVAVTKGTVNKNTQWTCTNATVPTIGTDNITFGQISGAGTYTNGNGLDLTANVFSLNSSYARGLFSATTPLAYNSTTGALTIQQANTSQAGYLSSSNWNTFNTKVSPTTTVAGFPLSGNITLANHTPSTGLTGSVYNGSAAQSWTATLSTGISGGQTAIGGTASGDNLTLSSTSNATKGKIIFGNSSYDEVNNRFLAISTSTTNDAIPTPFYIQHNFSALYGWALGISRNNNPTISGLLFGVDAPGNNGMIASNNSDLRIGRTLSGTFTEAIRVQNTTGYVGIGTSTPQQLVSIVGTGATSAAFLRSVAGGALASTGSMGQVQYGVFNSTTSTEIYGAMTRGIAAETWNPGTAQGTHWGVSVTPVGGTTMTERFRVGSDGILSASAYSTAGILTNNTSGVISSTLALPSGTTATTQLAGTNNTTVATTAFVATSFLTSAAASTTYAPINNPTFTSKVTLPVGTTSVGSLVFPSGALLTTPVNNTFENDGVLRFTQGGVRYTMPLVSPYASTPGSSDIIIGDGTTGNYKIINILSALNTTSPVVNTSASTLTLAFAKDVFFSGTTAIYTLPAINATSIGRYYQITISNMGTGAITVNSNAGGNDIYTTLAVNTDAITPGSVVTYMSNGTVFKRQ